MAKTPLNQLLDYVSMIDDGTIPVQLYFKIENLIEAEHEMIIQVFELGQSNPKKKSEDQILNHLVKFEKPKSND
jgi:hypothetical protein